MSLGMIDSRQGPWLSAILLGTMEQDQTTGFPHPDSPMNPCSHSSHSSSLHALSEPPKPPGEIMQAGTIKGR